MTQHVIYGLLDPNSRELRYIGYSSDIERRIKDHHRPIYLKIKSHKNHWIKSLLAQGQKADFIIIEEYSSAEELPAAEIETVEYYKWIGANLTNGTKGGDGHRKGDKLSEETKRKLSIRFSGDKHPMYGKTHTSEAKKKMSDALSGKNHPLWGKSHPIETIEKMSAIKLGKVFTDEHKDNISKSNSGENNPWFGKERSKETRDKISVSNTGKTKLTQEQIVCIINDTRTYKVIADEYGVHFKTIANYKRSKDES